MSELDSNSWKKQRESLVFDSYRKIISRTFLLPNGKETDYEVFTGPDFVVVAAFDTEGKAIINKQFRAGPEVALYGFPSGMVDEGEQAVDAAKRELTEETGFVAGEIEFLKTVKMNYGTFEQHSFIATNCQPIAEKRLDSTEFIENELWEIEKLKSTLRNPNENLLAHLDVIYMVLDRLGEL
jgi:ADP-ribose pyrophosphatase